MTYKIRHKGKQKEHFLAPGLVAPLVQVLLIVAALITAVLLPKPPEGKTDWVARVAVATAAAAAVLAGATRLLQALLGHRVQRPGVWTVVTLIYRAGFVLIISGVATAFYRAMFR
ncbi:MAG: hypothetical protein MUP47_03445 [Phycisphaerae bacterium]|nr:hypothetical protein [Phycisphaerae bacterium]